MLKKCYGLFLGLVVLAGSVCVTPTHASSASIIITNIRAGGQTSAAEEGIAFYNNSSFEVDITNWCVTNKSLVKFACITPDGQEKIFLPGYSYATIVSTDAQANSTPDFYTAVYEPSNHSSGAIVASADTVSLLDADNVLVDQYSWSSSVSSTQQWSRMKLTTLPDFYLDNNTASDWQKSAYTGLPLSQVEWRAIPPDPTDESQEPEDPSEPTEPPGDPVEPEQPVLVSLPVITEMLPNPAGSDTGNEFIELFNPNEETEISLLGYKLAIGPSFEKVITLKDYILKPGEYKAFSNAELSYSLLNSSSRVRLMASDGTILGETRAYDSPKDGEAWALIDEVWQYTSQPTPGAANSAGISSDEDVDDVAGESTAKPCAANQYRSLETNRCRLISSTASAMSTPCKIGQERNLETNRCRNIVVAKSTECKEGQEKNPDTNRCRNIKELSTVGYGVKGATSKKQGGMSWYVWAAVGGVVLLIIGYAVWEWRYELRKLFMSLKARFAAKVN